MYTMESLLKIHCGSQVIRGELHCKKRDMEKILKGSKKKNNNEELKKTIQKGEIRFNKGESYHSTQPSVPSSASGTARRAHDGCQ